MSETERPWVKLPANQIPTGARLWDHEGESYARFVKVRLVPSRSMMRSGTWKLVFIGAHSGTELDLILHAGPSTPIKVLREDAPEQK